MKRDKPLYVEKYKLSDKWFETVKESYNKKIDGYDIMTVNVPMFFEAVLRVDGYIPLIKNKLEEFFNKYKTKTRELKEVVNLLQKEFSTFNFVFKYSQYDSTNDKDKSGINELQFAKSTKDNSFAIFVWYNEYLANILIGGNFRRFKEKFLILSEHELIHVAQYISVQTDEIRDKIFKSKDNTDFIKYLSNKHEIMAYAKTIIEELRFGGYKNSDILNAIKYRQNEKSQILDTYIYHFEYKDEEVLHRLYKCIYEYLKG